jgi:excisionase family DNA binding protein
MEEQSGAGAGGVVRLTYTVEEVATLLGLSRNQTYANVQNGVIPARRVARRWVISRKALHEWLEVGDGGEVATWAS